MPLRLFHCHDRRRPRAAAEHHFRQRALASEWTRRRAVDSAVGVFAQLLLTQSTIYGTVSVDSGVVRNITVKHCTMYGGLRARNATFVHVSDVRFLLDDFPNATSYFNVIDTYETNGMTLLFENVFATAKGTPVAAAKGTPGFHLVALYRDANSTAILRNVTADSFRGVLISFDAFKSMHQATIDGVQMRNTTHLLYAGPHLGIRNLSIANVDASDVTLEANVDLIESPLFEEVRVTYMSVKGAVGRDVFRFDKGAPNALIVMRDIRISNVTFQNGVFARQVDQAVARVRVHQRSRAQLDSVRFDPQRFHKCCVVADGLDVDRHRGPHGSPRRLSCDQRGYRSTITRRHVNQRGDLDPARRRVDWLRFAEQHFPGALCGVPLSANVSGQRLVH
jgi:hypothetical protein